MSTGESAFKYNAHLGVANEGTVEEEAWMAEAPGRYHGHGLWVGCEGLGDRRA